MNDFLYNDIAYVGQLGSRVERFIKKDDYLWNFRCPFCGDSDKNKFKARGYLFKKDQKLIFKCHNCQVSTSFGKLLKEVDSSLYQQYIFDRFGKKKEKLPYIDLKEPEVEPINEIGLESFADIPDYHWAKKYVLDRGIPKKQLDRLFYAKNFGLWVKTITKQSKYQNFLDEPRLIIPIYDKKSKLIGSQGRSLSENTKSQRYITMKFDEHHELIFGLDKCNFNQRIMLVEGPIDSLFLPNCLAATGSDLSSKAEWLIKEYGIPKENLTLVFDNEKRNKTIQKLIRKAAINGYNICIWSDSIKEKDINDMYLSKIDVENVIRTSTKVGLEALLYT